MEGQAKNYAKNKKLHENLKDLIEEPSTDA
jgi:hypothetical protein